MKIGIDIGGSHIAIGLVDLDGKIILKKEKEIYLKDMINKNNKVIEQNIVLLINELLTSQKMDISNIEIIGIACPGTISNGIIAKAENLGIKNFNIINILKKYFDIPIYLKNDAKCAALAEKKYGSIKNYSDAVFLTVGTGVGRSSIFK